MMREDRLEVLSIAYFIVKRKVIIIIISVEKDFNM